MTSPFHAFPKETHKKIFTHLKKTKRLVLSGLGNTTAKSFLVSDFTHSFPKATILWVINNSEEFKSAVKCLDFWEIKNTHIWDYKISEDNYNDEQNLITLSKLYGRQGTPPQIILASRDSFLSKFPTQKEIQKQSIELEKNIKIENFELINFLIENGYKLNPDNILKRGEYSQEGGILTIFPQNSPTPIKLEFLGDNLEEIYLYDQKNKKIIGKLDKFLLWPNRFFEHEGNIAQHLPEDTILIQDELDIEDEDTEECQEVLTSCKKCKNVIFTAFPDDDDPDFSHLKYLSLLRFHNFYDLVNDIKEKKSENWHQIISTRRVDELKNILGEENISYSFGKEDPDQVHLIDATEHESVPHSFQNTEYKIELLTDKEIFQLKKRSLTGTQKKVYLDFLGKLKTGDYVVHIDQGIGIFLGTEKREIDGITREYLKLGYAQGDKLYVPIDQAEKVNKYIGQEDRPPRITRLGSAEWSTITSKVRIETEKIAGELLELYAARQAQKGHIFPNDTKEQAEFERAFPYDETPGQLRAIQDTKADMESEKQMDRLVCGDVGFGKTEVALRAAFKCVMAGKQVAFISPITILADQHFKGATSRMEDFPVKIEMLSRFKTPAQQKKVIADAKAGKVDIVIGTHRLLSKDIAFKNLGLIIVDEEQRFGVKQKEALKRLRGQVDVLTLTATPIPRTLNMALNGIRDISTITTPPVGRLPVVTEVRRYSENLIKNVIETELKRGGQVYFLHNRVQTIESMADKLRALVPAARIVVGHGKLAPHELEKRILAFKKGEYNVLVSSTIIENGIDLPNANTLIVNNADAFGLSQLYQLRGRVGRGKKQAYAYMLYQAQRLTLESKKRLRAIVEAAELGSGFQIAMRDLEIRGAGDILGVNQHGAINVVGVAHFVRMLKDATEELKSGRKVSGGSGKEEDISIELPISGYIPDHFIEDSRDKINVYQRLSSAEDKKSLDELRDELEEEYGTLPKEVKNLFKVLDFKMLARKAGVTNVRSSNVGGGKKQLTLAMSDRVKPENIFNVVSSNGKWQISGNKLKIDMSELGVHWQEGLELTLKTLAKKPRNLK